MFGRLERSQIPIIKKTFLTSAIGIPAESLFQKIESVLEQTQWESITSQPDSSSITAVKIHHTVVTGIRSNTKFTANLSWGKEVDCNRATLLSIEISGESDKNTKIACKSHLFELVNEIEIASREQAELTVY